jgi:hypothetical protein
MLDESLPRFLNLFLMDATHRQELSRKLQELS